MTQRIKTDLHSHCLPDLDDGAIDEQESIAMLRESLRQGIRTVAATPHFYYGDISIEQFLAERQRALDTLNRCIACTPDLDGRIRIIPGAEVLLRHGISQIDLRPLCLWDTNAILIELPFMNPSNWLYDELEDIALGQRLTVILAHVDRYRHWYSSSEILKMLDLPDLVVQLNGEAFLDAHEYRRLRKWLPQPRRLVLGSDMHHADRRIPNIQPACEQMRRHRKCGRDWLAQMIADADDLLYTL